MRRRLPRLFLVTNEDVVCKADFLERAAAALEVGGRGCALQLRAHRLKGQPLWDLARGLGAAAAAAGAGFWVNDRIDLALASRADGVQLGFRSLPVAIARRVLGRGCWIGCSVHGVSAALTALESDADLAVLGNVYPTASHPGRVPLGLDSVREAAAVGRPIVAIGGISVERTRGVVEAGAWGIAVVSGIWAAGDSGARVAEYMQAIEMGLASRA